MMYGVRMSSVSWGRRILRELLRLFRKEKKITISQRTMDMIRRDRNDGKNGRPFYFD